ncbi:MAG: restriction endonuclease [Pirellulales bacterium]
MNELLAHHYPPELMTLLIDAIPRLIKGKKDVLTFFRGCGVNPQLYADLEQIVKFNRDTITKFEIVRQVLSRLNDKGDATLASRREILKRVTQWDDFSTCYDNQRIEAKGYVGEIQKLVNVKDSFTRINLEREKERLDRVAQHKAEIAQQQQIATDRSQIKSEMFGLFAETNFHKRGKSLEKVLNALFKSYNILIREDFKRIGNAGEGIVEQIDGVVELDGEVYLVELKWWSDPLGVAEVSQHLVRVFTRHAARGILISQSGYTDPAITICRDSLARSVFVLATLEEIVLLLERDESLVKLLRTKVQAAIVEKNPFVQPLR